MITITKIVADESLVVSSGARANTADPTFVLIGNAALQVNSQF